MFRKPCVFKGISHFPFLFDFLTRTHCAPVHRLQGSYLSTCPHPNENPRGIFRKIPENPHTFPVFQFVPTSFLNLHALNPRPRALLAGLSSKLFPSMVPLRLLNAHPHGFNKDAKKHLVSAKSGNIPWTCSYGRKKKQRESLRINFRAAIPYEHDPQDCEAES